MRILCVLGKNQYGDPGRQRSAEYAGFIPALRTLGHDVRHFESWDRKLQANLPELNESLVDAVRRFQPDVVFAVQSRYEIWLETWDWVRNNTDAALVNWVSDDSWRYWELSRLIANRFDLMITTCPTTVTDYHRDGLYNVAVSQWGIESGRLRRPVPSYRCEFPVTFIGTAHGDRRKRVERLRRQGIDVKCWGHGWERGPLEESRVDWIVRHSIVSLNFANSRGRPQIKARTFEVPGTGGFLLTEYAQGLEERYDIEDEIAVFRDEDQLIERVRYFLANPEHRDEIARRGYLRTATHHTYEQRMKEILDHGLNARARRGQSKATAPVAVEFRQVVGRHVLGPGLRFVRTVLVLACTLLFGKQRATRAARRVVFELSWRLCGHRTYESRGWPGLLFPGV